MLSVLIVDCHLVVRQGLQHILKDEFGDVVFGEADTAAGALHAATTQPWDIIVLAIDITGSSEFEILEQIRRHRPGSRILILTMGRSSRYADRAFKLGALACVTNDAGRAELVAAFRSALCGRKYRGSSVSEMAAADPAIEPDIEPDVLSFRERTVLLGLASGKRIQEIAAELELHEKTVSTYRRRVLDKLHRKSNADLVRYVIDHKLS
jgi:DNA-binding NarL/FixJ family response regulator